MLAAHLSPAPAPRPADPRVPAALALGWLLLAAGGGVVALLVQPWVTPARAALLLAAALLPAAGLWWLARAGQQGGLALALWGGAVVLLSDATWRSSGGSLDLQSALKFALWVGGLLLVFWRAPELRRALCHLPSGALAAYGLWCVAGTVYSATPAYTLGAALSFLGVWVLAVVTAQCLGERRGLWLLSGALLLSVALSLLLYAALPERAMTVLDNGRSLRLSGIFGSPNNLARAAALGLLCAVLLLPGMRRGPAWAWLTLALVLCGGALVLTGSRGAVAALLLALGAALLGWRPLWAAALAFAAALCAGLLWWQPELAHDVAALLSRSGRASEVGTLTGRTEIWQAVLQLIEQAPQLGHGYASTREVLPAYWSDPFGWTTTSAHNLWLQAAVTTGALGLLLLLAAQAGWLWCLCRQRRPARDAVIVFVLAIGVLEASAAGPSVNLMSFAWAWAAALGLASATPEKIK